MLPIDPIPSLKSLTSVSGTTILIHYPQPYLLLQPVYPLPSHRPICSPTSSLSLPSQVKFAFWCSQIIRCRTLRNPVCQQIMWLLRVKIISRMELLCTTSNTSILIQASFLILDYCIGLLTSFPGSTLVPHLTPLLWSTCNMADRIIL